VGIHRGIMAALDGAGRGGCEAGELSEDALGPVGTSDGIHPVADACANRARRSTAGGTVT
jgi:hypothetical protein